VLVQDVEMTHNADHHNTSPEHKAVLERVRIKALKIQEEAVAKAKLKAGAEVAPNLTKPVEPNAGVCKVVNLKPPTETQAAGGRYAAFNWEGRTLANLVCL
jgi:hypothetical protein